VRHIRRIPATRGFAGLDGIFDTMMDLGVVEIFEASGVDVGRAVQGAEGLYALSSGGLGKNHEHRNRSN
jgi:hypothetical protein